MFGWLFRDKAADDFEKRHPVGFLMEPKEIDSLPILKFSAEKFVAPDEVLLPNYCTRVEDQGSLPACAGYAASQFAENILWRKKDVPPDIDPIALYKYAKTIDGKPNSDGTSLTAVLQALLDKNYFDKTMCSIKVIRNLDQVKYAIHKFGCCLLGMNISKEWYKCNANKPSIYGQGDQTLIGGHAVLCCGYTTEGIMIYNSWGVDWGHYGYALVTWNCANKQFSYGAVLNNCLYDMNMN
ncbi:MAG: hypothetical protein J6Q22_10715 [Prevotella sp.]|nr:hypothetical protein [Prevotella sp.]